jgi:hypothetical protein
MKLYVHTRIQLVYAVIYIARYDSIRIPLTVSMEMEKITFGIIILRKYSPVTIVFITSKSLIGTIQALVC